MRPAQWRLLAERRDSEDTCGRTGGSEGAACDEASNGGVDVLSAVELLTNEEE